jgi:hypothetical protein
MRVPKSSLTKPRRFLLEFAPDGFRAQARLNGRPKTWTKAKCF